MNKQLEKWYPYGLAFIVPAVVFLLRRYGFSPDASQVISLLNGATGFGGILVGFLATALAILFAAPDGPAVRFMKRTGGLKLIVGYLEQAIVGGLAATLGAMLILFFLPNIRSSGYLFVVGLIWSYVFGAAVLAFHRAAWITARLLRQLLE